MQAMQFEMDAPDNPATILPVTTVISFKAWGRVALPRDRGPRNTLDWSRRRSRGSAILLVTLE